MNEALTLEIIENRHLAPEQYAEILALGTRAFEEDFAPFLKNLTGATHVLGRYDGKLVSHAAWITRWLQTGSYAALRTAYVEAVATEPAYERRGFASTVMRRLQECITDFELAALAPAEKNFYARLGWELWRGPLYIRSVDGLLAMPDEEVMILKLPSTPPLDLEAALSAEWREGELW